jgi:hypothetical protein
MSWLKRILGLDEITTFINSQLNGTAQYNDYSSDIKKLECIFSNPALMKVFALQCDLFSLGKVYVYKDGKEIENDPYLSMLKKPNYFQFQSQFLWDMMFWNMVGNTYNYCESKIISDDNNLYILENNKIQYPYNIRQFQDKIILSKQEKQNFDNLKLKYTYADGSSTDILWSNIIHTPDLTNGTGNWFRGASRIDSLYKIISNSEASMDALNINIRYSGKFMVAGKADPDNVSQIPMGEIEKIDIETKMNGRKSVHAVKSMIDIKRFVENIAALKLDEIGLAQYFLIGTAYGIPKDVLETFNSGTYENQEKARGAFVSYCLQPKGKLFFDGHAHFFGYAQQNKEIIIDWEHLPFMQVFAKERAETDYIKTKSLVNLAKLNISIDEINSTLDTNFSSIDYIAAQNITTSNKN